MIVTSHVGGGAASASDKQAVKCSHVMEKYERSIQGVEEELTEGETPLAEVRVSPHGQIKEYVSAAMRLLEATSGSITVVGRGKAISRAVTVVEIVKRRVPGLHQHTSIGSVTVTDVWSSKSPQEPLDKVQVVRSTPTITVTLSLSPLDESLPGYQPPQRVAAQTPETGASSSVSSPPPSNQPSSRQGRKGSGPRSHPSKQRRTQPESL